MYQKMLNVGQGGAGASSADQISYDNTISGLNSENVQDAVDEINSNLSELSGTCDYSDYVDNPFGVTSTSPIGTYEYTAPYKGNMACMMYFWGTQSTVKLYVNSTDGDKYVGIGAKLPAGCMFSLNVPLKKGDKLIAVTSNDRVALEQTRFYKMY